MQLGYLPASLDIFRKPLNSVMVQESEASSRQRIVAAESEASTGTEGLASKVDRDAVSDISIC